MATGADCPPLPYPAPWRGTGLKGLRAARPLRLKSKRPAATRRASPIPSDEDQSFAATASQFTSFSRKLVR